MNKQIEVRNVRIKPGEKKSGFLKIGELAPEVPVNIPFIVVNGLKKGSILSLIGGAHTAEMSGIVAIIRVLQELNPKELSGSLIAVPCVNILGLPYYPDRYCPIDQKNINRFYPGNPKGSITDRLCNIVFEEIIQKGDYLVDLHDLGVLSEAIPFSTFHISGNKEVDTASEALAKYSGTKVIVSESSKYDRGMSIAEASEREIPGIIHEAATSRGVDTQYRAIINIMKHLGMIEGESEVQVDQKIYQGGFHWLSANHGGIIFPALEKVGKMVSKDERIGQIKNIFGETIEEIKVPEKGLLLYIKYGGIVNTGDSIGELAFEYPRKEPENAMDRVLP